jgi:hypothetical protein
MSGKNASVENITKHVSVEEVAKPEFITDEDRHTLDLIKMRRMLAATNAEKAELSYNNFVLQLTLKYTLKEKDAITEQGEILRGTQA